jgi:RNA polymerase sigma-70 factor (ECF subfamily)
MVNELDFNIHSELIENCKNGDRTAQFRIYKLYSKAMFNLAFRMTNNREDAEDLLQDSFVECFRKLGSFRFESTFGAWLKTITINRCINYLRKKKLNILFYDELPEPEVSDETEPVYNTEKIFNGIQNLPDGYRVILTLYLLEGYDHSEISQILGISESTSKSQYSRAKDKLRKSLLKN